MKEFQTSGTSLDGVSKQVVEKGFGVIRRALDEDTVAGFVKQIQECITEATQPQQKKRDKSVLEEGAATVRAHDASFGRGDVISLDDASTWPMGGTRRVLECVPLGEGAHWERLLQCTKLRDVLDEILGADCWEIPVNTLPSGSGDVFIRHWYSPVVFPEHVYGLHSHPPEASAHSKGTGHVKRDVVTGHTSGVRSALLCSWKEEIAVNGPLQKETAGVRWQPVNRRRFNSKGWHIDIGPGFAMGDERTLQGDPRQGVILLLILSDWEAGCGGTAFVPGSHEWVRGRLQEAHAKGMTHDDLNMWCQDRMKSLTQQQRIFMSLGDSPSPVVPDECHVIEQIVGKKGDIVVCHPWVIHSGTTNMGDAARLMCNGMVTIKRDAFERVGCMVLRGTGRK